MFVGLRSRITVKVLESRGRPIVTLTATVTLLRTLLLEWRTHLPELRPLTTHLVSRCADVGTPRARSRLTRHLFKLRAHARLPRQPPPLASWPPTQKWQLGVELLLLLPQLYPRLLRARPLPLLPRGLLRPLFILSVGPPITLLCTCLLSLIAGHLSTPTIRTRRGARCRRRCRPRRRPSTGKHGAGRQHLNESFLRNLCRRDAGGTLPLRTGVKHPRNPSRWRVLAHLL